MNEYIFQAEVVSPLFVGGANQEPDFSASSLKGALRFWFRALKGAILYSSGNDHNQVVEKLSESEANIFGSTSKAGSVFIDVEPIKANTEPFQMEVKGRKEYSLIYAGYGLQGQRGTDPRKGFKTGSTFNVRFLFSQKNEKNEKLFLDSLFLLSVFGNLGARSSRGFGSVMFTKFSGTGSYPTLNPGPLNQAIEKALSAIISDHNIKKPGVQPGFPTISPAYFNYKVYGERQPEAAYSILTDFGKRLRKFREDKNSPAQRNGVFHSYDYKAVKLKKTADANDNIFGIPRNFQFSDHSRDEIEISHGYERRNSPLKLKLIKSNNKLYPVIVLFQSDFLPSGATLSVKNTKHRLNPPQFSRAIDFMNKLKEGGF